MARANSYANAAATSKWPPCKSTNLYGSHLITTHVIMAVDAEGKGPWGRGGGFKGKQGQGGSRGQCARGMPSLAHMY